MLFQKWKWRLAQRLEAWWWKRYLRGKTPGDYLSWKKAYWESFLQNLQADVSPEHRILDAGCGPAGIFMVLPGRVTALDPLLERYEKELPHFNRSLYPGVNFLAGRLEDFSSPEPYDRVFCLNALNHVQDIRRATQNLAAGLDARGRAYISVDVHRFGWLKYIFRLFPGDALHPHQLGGEDYRRLFAQAGLQTERRVLIKRGRIFDYEVFELTK